MNEIGFSPNCCFNCILGIVLVNRILDMIFNCQRSFVLFAASVPIGRPEKTISTRHRPHDIASQQLVSAETFYLLLFYQREYSYESRMKGWNILCVRGWLVKIITVLVPLVECSTSIWVLIEAEERVDSLLDVYIGTTTTALHINQGTLIYLLIYWNNNVGLIVEQEGWPQLSSLQKSPLLARVLRTFRDRLLKSQEK